MKPLFIIPARIGSKGIPRKNIKLLNGRPLIAYSIDAAKGAGADSDHLIVSTEAEEVAAIADSLGASTAYRRPDELATDTAGSREMMLHAMDWADSRGIAYDCVVLLQPTSPLRTAADVKAAMELYDADTDMVVSVTEARCNPYYNCFETDPLTGMLHVSKGDGLYTRRQDAPPAWEYNGAVYVINPASLRAMPMGAFSRRRPYVMDAARSVDLDTPTDWIVAEALIKSDHSNHQPQ